MAKKPTFVGFSTHEKLSPSYTLTDVELIKQDLLNTFLTIKGERVMRPNYGSNVHKLLYDHLDDITRELVSEDISGIIANDPRVSLVDMRMKEFNHGLLVELLLKFLPSGDSDSLLVRFEKQGRDAI